MSVVRCPFCDRRYNVTGIPPGTKVLCTACRATLTVPALHRRVRTPLWRRLVPQSSSTQVALGLVGGLVVATVAYIALRPRPVETAVVEPTPEPAPGPLKDPPRKWWEPPLARMPGTRDDQIRQFTDGMYREFENIKFWFDSRPISPFVLAGETNPRVTLYLIFQEYQRALDSLQLRFRQEFGEPLRLGEIDEILPVIIFTSRETFDEYQRRGNNPPLPPQVPGVYEYSKKRVVFLHSSNGYPIEVILHEGVHQIIHYYFRQQAAQQERRQSLWFQEGMATYFEQFKRDATAHAAVDPSLASARLPALKEAIRRGDLPPLWRLMGMDIEDIWQHWSKPAATPEEQEQKMRFAELCYGEAWALVHFLRHGAGGKYRKLFDEYFKHELKGQGGKDDFIGLLSDRFGMELGQLQLELEEYLATLP